MTIPRAIALVTALLAVPSLSFAQTPDTRGAHTSTPDPTLDELALVQRRGELLARRVMTALDEARRARNPVRIQCLDRSLSQVNSTLRELERRAERIHRAPAAADSPTQRHDRSVVRVLDRRFRSLEREARVCNGEVEVTRSRTRVVVTIAPEVPDEDPTVPPGDRHRTTWVPPPGMFGL